MLKLAAVVLLSAATTVAASQPTAGTLAPSAPTLAAMQAHLDPSFRGSWNAMAGPTAADAVLVAVQVAGPPSGAYTGFFGPRTRYSFRLVAREFGTTPAGAARFDRRDPRAGRTGAGLGAFPGAAERLRPGPPDRLHRRPRTW